mgnify:CR=1 FL=1
MGFRCEWMRHTYTRKLTYLFIGVALVREVELMWNLWEEKE